MTEKAAISHRFRRLAPGVFAGAALVALALPATGQGSREISARAYEGMFFHVAAPQGASWSLDCRFRPVTVRGATYNTFQLSGQGGQGGRLPSNDARCTLTKTGGSGPIGLAIVRDGQPHAAGTNSTTEPARVNLF